MTLEETLAHLERGARIAFRALDAQAVSLSDEEREWYDAERLRLDYVELEVVYYGRDSLVANRVAIDFLPRKEAEDQRAARLAVWAEEGKPLIETDGSRWAVEIREASE